MFLYLFIFLIFYSFLTNQNMIRKSKATTLKCWTRQTNRSKRAPREGARIRNSLTHTVRNPIKILN